MPYPVFLAGQGLTAGQLAAMQPQYIVKPAQESVGSSTTLQDDDHLRSPLVAGAVYDVRFLLYAAGNGSTGPTTPADQGRIKTAWSVPPGCTGLKACMGHVGPDRDSSLMRSSSHNFNTAVNYDLESTASASAIIERSLLTVGGTAGDLRLQWAQVNVGGTPTLILAGSSLRITRVS